MALGVSFLIFFLMSFSPIDPAYKALGEAATPEAIQKYHEDYGLDDPWPVNLWIDEGRKIIAFSRGNLIFLFDFHTSYSEQHFFLPCHTTGEGKYRVILSTDEFRFGGAGLVSHDYEYRTEQDPEQPHLLVLSARAARLGCAA